MYNLKFNSATIPITGRRTPSHSFSRMLPPSSNSAATMWIFMEEELSTETDRYGTTYTRRIYTLVSQWTRYSKCRIPRISLIGNYWLVHHLVRPVLFGLDGLHDSTISNLVLRYSPQYYYFIANSTNVVFDNIDIAGESKSANVAKNTDGVSSPFSGPEAFSY